MSINSRNPHMQGILNRRGLFKDWNLRHIELKDNVISYSIIKRGIGFGSFRLTKDVRCEESSLRPFCFLIEDAVTRNQLYLAADTVAEKESWIEAIQASLSLLRLKDRQINDKNSRRRSAGSSVDAEKIINQYQQRPMIYIKVIQARNLEAKDVGGTSDPYVKLTLGSSTVRTTTRQKNLNPDWGMVFPFDWDRSMRYAKVEVWDEDYSSADDFLGSVFIPIFSYHSGFNNTSWYRLGKRSTKSHVSGEIEIEIACTGDPNPEQYAWHFFREIQALDDFRLNLASRYHGSGQIALTNFDDDKDAATTVLSSSQRKNSTKPDTNSNTDTTVAPTHQQGSIKIKQEQQVMSDWLRAVGFPRCFPPIENEILEDISLRVHLVSVVNTGKVSSPGVLMLTNYRLLFVSLALISKLIVAHSNNNSDSGGDSGGKNYNATSSSSSSSSSAAYDMTDFGGGGVAIDSEGCGVTSGVHTRDAAGRNNIYSRLKLDMSTQIPVNSIASVHLTFDTDATSQGGATSDALRLRLSDGRTLAFLFKDDADNTMGAAAVATAAAAALANHKPGKFLKKGLGQITGIHTQNKDQSVFYDPSEDIELRNSAFGPPFPGMETADADTDTGAGVHNNDAALSHIDNDEKEMNSRPVSTFRIERMDSQPVGVMNETAKKRAVRKLSVYNYYNNTSPAPSGSSNNTNNGSANAGSSLGVGVSSNTAGGDKASYSSNDIPKGLSPIGIYFARLMREQAILSEALDAMEGPPANRMFNRLKHRSINRGNERHNAINLHKDMLDGIRAACGDDVVSPDDNDNDNVKLGIEIVEKPAIAATANRISAALLEEKIADDHASDVDEKSSIVLPAQEIRPASMLPLPPVVLSKSDSNRKVTVRPMSEDNSQSQKSRDTTTATSLVAAETTTKEEEKDKEEVVKTILPTSPVGPVSNNTPFAAVGSCVAADTAPATAANNNNNMSNSTGGNDMSAPQPPNTATTGAVATAAYSKEGRPVLPLGWSAPESELTQEEALQRRCTLRGLEQQIRSSHVLHNTFTKCLFNIDRSWQLYDPVAEMRRLGVPNEQWRISHANRNYELCETYPAVLGTPANVEDSVLFGSAQFRSKGRVPALCWLNAVNGCSISRCSQPLIGLGARTSPDDYILLAEMNRCGQPGREPVGLAGSLSSGGGAGDTAGSRQTMRVQSRGGGGGGGGADHQTSLLAAAASATSSTFQKPYIIVDARPLLNAKANQAAGKGVESDKTYENIQVLFMDIANIHAVRKSLELLEDSCSDEASWLRNLEYSGWLGHIRKILLAAGRIVHCVSNEGLSVLIHCSDGWDRTSQLCSLSMLMMDDYYRTLDGFIVLIEKEWLSFGHKFADRLGWTVDGWKDEERSPIFAQFLDCVHQCLVQNPQAFEFNEQLLLFLMEHLSSGWFGNFLFNCERELKAHLNGPNGEDCGMISIWTAVLGNRNLFVNPSYSQAPSPVIPVITKSRLVVWSAWFLSWSDRMWQISWKETNKLDLKKLGYTQSGAWVENETVTNCTTCSRPFTFFRRKHHCRCCGQIFCEMCASEYRIMPTISKWRPCRCCSECARLIDDSDAPESFSYRTHSSVATDASPAGAGKASFSFKRTPTFNSEVNDV